MHLHIIVLLTILLLLAVSFYSIRLIRSSVSAIIWIMVFIGSVMLLIDRLIYFYRVFYLTGDQPVFLFEELLMLIISALYFTGVYFVDDLLSDMQKTEAELEDSRYKYQTLLENISDGILVTRDDEISFVNDKIVIDTAYTREELIGMPLRRLFDEKNFNRLSGSLRNLSISGLELEDVPIKTKENASIYVHLKILPIRWEEKTARLFFFDNVTEAYRIRHRLGESETQYRTLFEQANDAIFLMKEDKFIECNRRTLEMFLCSRDEILNHPPYQFSPEKQPDGKDSESEAQRRISKAINGEPQFFEWKHKRLNEEEFDAEVSLKAIELSGMPFILAIVRDVTQRKKAETALKNSLGEKELLLKELHHRVKNNLQIIDSLLTLQMNENPNALVKESFKEISNRIKSFSYIHETIYFNRKMAENDFSAYIEKLALHLISSYPEKSGNISLKLEMQNVSLTMETALNCGLIINELVTNAIKHAFEADEKGIVEIGLQQEDGVVYLYVWDSGNKLPEGFSLEKISSLGLHLIVTMVRQLTGNLTYSRKGGTKFIVEFQNTSH